MKLNKLFAILIMLSTIAVIFAHPASDVKPTFDLSKGSLVITYDHKVKDGGEHFIFDVKILLNKKEIINQKMGKQDSIAGGTVYYKIVDAKVGDKITVVTDCNKGGKKSIVIDVK
ncbi:MAG: hypothetical protein CVU48_05375 [Candidatus Cloacimonetes bacterium HGW-Cloacimonetes-1]|jgi:hypothetical protein|nr:MAG: hypothetical protein CVU48_05375 [Candidatus Cloacimonetes bacterium HGW-Cloacimonetes-1]